MFSLETMIYFEECTTPLYDICISHWPNPLKPRGFVARNEKIEIAFVSSDLESTLSKWLAVFNGRQTWQFRGAGNACSRKNGLKFKPKGQRPKIKTHFLTFFFLARNSTYPVRSACRGRLLIGAATKGRDTDKTRRPTECPRPRLSEGATPRLCTFSFFDLKITTRPRTELITRLHVDPCLLPKKSYHDRSPNHTRI